jgi:hypothetical protein
VLLILTFVAAGVSLGFTSMVFVQTTYVWWCAGFCLGAGLIYSERSDRRASGLVPVLRMFALCALIFVISFANPGRVLLMMVLPLYAFDRVVAHALNPIRPADSSRIAHAARLLGLNDRYTWMTLAAGFALAAFVYFLLTHTGRIQSSYNAAGLRWGGVASVWRHLATLTYWFDYLGAGFSGGDESPNLAAPTRQFRYALALGATLLSLCEVVRLRRSPAPRRGLAVALIVAFVPIFVVYTLFEPLAISGGTLRYFMVAFIIVIVLPAFVLDDLLAAWPVSMRGAMSACGCLLVLVAIQHFLPQSILARQPTTPISPASTRALAQELEAAGLQWGYATWWNAGATTVLSDAKIRVSPIEINTAGISPWRYMILKDWYLPSAWTGQTFLALRNDEYAWFTAKPLNYVLGEPKRLLETPGFKILVFEQNIASRFMSCDMEAHLDERLRKEGPSPKLISAKLESLNDSGAPQVLKVRIRNDTPLTLSGAGSYPLSVGVQLLDSKGRTVRGNWNHTLIGCPLQAGQESTITVLLPKAPPGDWRIHVDLVQEGVVWLGSWGLPTFSLPLIVGAEDSLKEQSSHE